MIDRDFLLASSLKAFLIHDAFAFCQLASEKPLIEFVEEGELNEVEIYISLMKWEIHHGLKIDLEAQINLSITEIVESALSQPELSVDHYKEHFLQRLDEISEAYEVYYSRAAELEEMSDQEGYLNNRN